MKNFVTLSGLALLAAFFSAASLAVFWGSNRLLKVRRESVSSARLKRPLRILHLSDLHVGSAPKLNEIMWRKIDALDFDMAVLTGDILLDDMRELDSFYPRLQKLCRRVPVFIVEGNHEILYAGQMKEKLSSLGARVLHNESERMTVNGNDLRVIGLRDYYVLKENQFADIPGVFQNADASGNCFRLVLSHQPQLFPKLLPFKPDLTLSGHTHGGQLALPFFPTIYAPGQGFFPKYGSGFYKEKGCVLYVSKGVGGTHFKYRFWCRPEIAVITVKLDDQKKNMIE